ncbi:ML domain-containing protein [Mycena epipterygia]|nr:ML domain-containing protein [Mycena epipterygia]
MRISLLLAPLYFAVALGLPNSAVHQRLSTGFEITAATGWEYADCGLSSDPIQIESISVSPDPPQPGQDLTVTVKGTVTDEIVEGAYADVTVKLGLIKLLQKEFGLCEEARTANSSIQCPVDKGTYTVSQTVALPAEIPKAKYTVYITGYTIEDDDMLCLQLKVDFMKSSFLSV